MSTGPPPPGELGSWGGKGVRIGRVLEALAELRRAERRTATRTSVVNLVVVAADAEDAERACDAMHRLETGHPGRTVVLVREPEAAEAGLDAEVRLLGAAGTSSGAWSDEVRLWVHGELDAHLYSLVEPLTLPDVPVAVWFLGRLPEPDDPVLAAADVVVVDTKEAADRRTLDLLVRLARRHEVLDLSWIRLQPWRELLGNLFELAPFRPFLGGVQSVTVQGKPGPRRLTAGWLSSRLGLPESSLGLVDARHLLVELVCDHDGRTGTFTVDRPQGQRLVRSRAEVPGTPPYEDRLVLPDDALPWSLGRALTRLEAQVSYGPALRAAVSFAS